MLIIIYRYIIICNFTTSTTLLESESHNTCLYTKYQHNFKSRYKVIILACILPGLRMLSRNPCKIYHVWLQRRPSQHSD